MAFGGGGDAVFTHKSLVFAMVILIMMPMLVGIFAPANLGHVDENEVLDGYERMTGQTASPRTSVWVLTGIYLPVDSGQTTFGTTDDGWIYGSEVKAYSPHQYVSTPKQYEVVKDSNGVFRYADLGTGGSLDYDPDRGLGHKAGDLYTMVNFDDLRKSDIFFSEGGRTDVSDGFFYYQYSGYRMAFQPIAPYNALDEDGNKIPVIPTTTSLSLIWYEFPAANGSGVSGNLVLSGNLSGVSYLNSAMIVSAFNQNTSSASFDMVFNGIEMGIIISLDVTYLTAGYTVEECYNNGWWSIMVTSESADPNAYTGTDSAMNPLKLLKVMWDLFTFNYNDYNMSAWLASICSIIFVLPLYSLLLANCFAHPELWVLTGIMTALQAISAAMSIFG